MEIQNRWKAENWEPEALLDLYVKAGAKYFVALANHHDNLDCYDSKYHGWNTVRVGPEARHRRHLGQGARARAACASASATIRRTPGTGSRPPTATTPKARTPASATTRSA